MQNHNLISLTVQFLNLIINMYNYEKFDRDMFYYITKLKIKFLEDSILSISSLEEKKEILSILDNYKGICYCLESESK